MTKHDWFQNSRFAKAYSDVFQPFVTITFVWSLVEICSSMLMIQLQTVKFSCRAQLKMYFIRTKTCFNFFNSFFQLHRDDNMAVLFIISLQTFYAFGVMFVSCELSQRICLAFEECYEMINQFEWYFWPADIQRILPIIMSYAQRPVEIQCFGSWACGRETFKYVSAATEA